MLSQLDVLLFAILTVREIFYHIATQKLVNKAMSRSFYEYEQAKQLKNEEKVVKEVVQAPPFEDLGYMQEF